MGPIPWPRNSERSTPGIASEDDVSLARRRLRLVAALATAAMLVASWPLWTEGGEIPRVPFWTGNPTPSAVVSQFVFAVLVAATLATGCSRKWRRWFALSASLLVAYVLGDQHRFQPWAYQFAVTLALLATLPGGRGLKYARWWYIAIYVHSGISKLDRSFCEELGPVFLDSALQVVGRGIASIPREFRAVATLTMPAAEILVGVALAYEPTRRIGRFGAVVLHGFLILILGPLGLSHSALVLAWNAAMLIEVWIAFGPRIGRTPHSWRTLCLSLPTVAAFWILVLLPFGERSGSFDAWPSHALYASHVGRVSIHVHMSDREVWPAGVRRHLRPVEGDDAYAALDLNAWSRAERGTPVYPQIRACLGLAEGLAARYGGGLLTRVVVYGPARVWDGTRSREEIKGLAAIRRRADRFLLNAHPVAARD